jgi:hypothetical protein
VIKFLRHILKASLPMVDFYASPEKDISNHFNDKSYNTFDVDIAETEIIPYIESSNATRSYQGIILSSISMLLAILSASSIGPMFKVANSLQKSET